MSREHGGGVRHHADRKDPRGPRKISIRQWLFATIGTALVGLAGSGSALILTESPAAAAVTKTYAYVSEPFTGANVHIPSDWVKPLVGGIPKKNYACLTGAKATTAAVTPTLATSTPANPIAPCWTSAQGATVSAAGTGFLRLTRAAGNEDGGVAYRSSVPTAQGVDISFNAYMYGGNGADGIVFFLAGTTPFNPHKKTVTLGPFGGHLGYSGGAGTPTGTGLSGGYMGFGLDTFGNFTRTAYNGTGCANPPWANNVQYTRSTKGVATTLTGNVTIRGPGTARNGYCLLASTRHTTLDGATATTKKLDLHGALRTATAGTTAARSQVPVEIAINPTSAAITSGSNIAVPAYSYVMAVSPLHGPQVFLRGSLPTDTFLEASHPSWVNAGGVPKQFILGWTGSTGGSNDFHEIRDMAVGPLVKNPPRFGISLTDNSSHALVAGSTVIYTANPVVSATGGNPTAVPTVTTVFPSLMTPGTATGTTWSCHTTLPSTVTCTYLGAVPPAGTALPPITMPAKVTATATLTKQVTTYLSLTGSVVGQAEDIGVVGAAKAKAFLGLTMSDSNGGALVQGKTVNVYAVGTISIQGTNETVAPKFTTTFPANLTPGTPTIHPTWTCPAPVGQVVTCTYTGTLPIAKGTMLGKITIPATVATFATGSLPIPGTLSSTNATPLSVTATDFATVVSLPQLKLGIADTKAGVFAAATAIKYTLTPSVSATGWNEADAPTVTDSFPTYFTTVVVTTATNWTCPAATGTAAAGWTIVCKWKGAPIQRGFGTSYTPIVLTATTKGAGTAPAGTVIDNTANISSTDAGPVTATDYGDIGARPVDLTLTLTSPSGDSIGSVYNLVIHGAVLSAGGKTTAKPVVTITLPAGDHLTGLPSGTKWVCAAATTVGGVQKDVCTYTTAAVPSGTTLPALTAVIKPTVLGQYNATVEITDNTDRAIPVFVSANVNVTADPQLTLPAPTVPAHAAVNSVYSATFTPGLKAAGGVAYHDPSVQVTLPAGETVTLLTPPAGLTWMCTVPLANVVTCKSTKSPVLAAGAALPSFTVHIKVTSGVPAAKVVKGKMSDASDTAAPVTDTATTTTTATPTLSVVTSTSPASGISVGVAYKLKVSPAVATNIVYYHPKLTVKLTGGETFATTPVTATWTCSRNAGHTLLTCTSKKAITPAAGFGPGSLGTFFVTVNTPVVGANKMVATLTDTTDGATAATTTKTVTVTKKPVLALTDSGTPTGGASVGTTYTLVLKPGLPGATGGVAHHEPVLTIVLPAGESFVGLPTGGANWLCGFTGTQKVICNYTAALPIATTTTLGNVTAKVKITTTGTKTVKATLADATDLATTVNATIPTFKATPTPILKVVATPKTVVSNSVGTSYTLTVASTITGGKTFHAPQVLITLPTNEAFTPAATLKGLGWTCTVLTIHTAKCKTTATSVFGALPNITGPVKFISALPSQTTTVTLSDVSDAAVSNTSKYLLSSTPTPVLKETATPLTVVSHSIGTTYKLTLKSTVSSGTTYNKPVVNVTLPTTESFTGLLTGGVKWTCTVLTIHTAKCTDTSASVIGTLGNITGKVKFTGAGVTQITTATLSDPVDKATANSSTFKESSTTTPVLKESATPVTVVSHSIGTTYKLTLKSTVSGGTTYNKPVVNVTLPTTETFTGFLTGGVKWTCTILTIHTAKCTDTSASVIGTLGNITGTVKFTGAGATQVTTATLSDPVDNATANSSTFKESSTTTPVLKETATPVTVVSHSIGTTYKLTLKSTVSGGTTYNKPVVNITLPTTETFTGILTGGVKWTCTILTIHTAKCTDTSASVLGTLGNITGTVKFSGAGVTQVTTATLSDPVDNATANSSTFKESSTTTPVLKETASPLTVVSHSIGTTYKLTLKSTVSSGTTYNKPVVNVTLPTTETFTGLLTGGAKWTCTILTIHTAKCTDTSASVIGTLGNITGTVKFSGAGVTQVTTATLSDPVDNATANSSTFKESSTTTPVLKETATPLTVASHSIGTTYKLTLKSTVSKGTTYNKPVVNVTLPTTETFTGLLTGGVKWTCTILTIHTAKCTDTSASVIGTLGNITGTIKFSGAGATQVTTATLSDPVDNATANSSTFKESSTTTPVLKETATPLTVVSHSIGTTYKLTLKSTVSKGTTYNKPVVNVILPTTETFTGLLTGGLKWTCTVLTIHTAKCTDTSASVIGTLGNITGTVKFSGAGATQVTTATLSDPVDNATANSSTFKESSTTTPVLKETASPLTVVSHSIGTTYKLTLKSTVSSGTTYNKPVVNVTLPTTETFTGLLTGGAKWTCTILTIHTAKCTDSSASVLGTLGNITGTVKFTGAGVTQVTTATLSDPVDNATANSSTFKESSTTTPVLKETASPLTVASHSIGTTYKLSLKSTVSKGTTYNKPVVNVTLPTTETFTGLLTGGAKWTCTILTIHTAKCTDTSASVLGTLGNITGTVKFSGAGVTQVTTATLSDPVDNATANSSTFKESSTTTPVLKETATPLTVVSHSIGTTYKLTLKSTVSSGTTYNKPVVNVTLPTTETFTGLLAGGAKWTCTILTIHTAKCTDTSASVLGTLGNISGTVKFTGAGVTQVTTATLSDPVDNATANSSTFKESSTTTPVLKETATPLTVVSHSIGTTYKLTIKSTVSSGTTYNKPVVNVTLPTTETFTGFLTGGAKWTCTVLTIHTAKCTDTSASVLGTLGNITGTVKFSGAGVTQITTATLSDPVDNATANSSTFKESSTTTPVLKETATPLTVVSHSIGTTYKLTLKSTISKGTTYNKPVVNVTLPTTETFTGILTGGVKWTCTILTIHTAKCTDTSASVLGTLGNITGTVKFTGAGVTLPTKAVLSDTTDVALKSTSSFLESSTTDPVLTLPVPSGIPSTKSTHTKFTAHFQPGIALGSATTYNAPVLTITLSPGGSFVGTPTGPPNFTCIKVTSRKAVCTDHFKAHGPGPLGTITAIIFITTSGTLAVTAVLSDTLDHATPVSRRVSVTAATAPVLALSMSTQTNISHAAVGTSYILTITPQLSPLGSAAKHNPKLTVVIPSFEMFKSIVGHTGWKCTIKTTQTLSCVYNGHIPAATLKPVTVTVKITAPGSGTMFATLSDVTDAATSVTFKLGMMATTTPVLKETASPLTVVSHSIGTTYKLTLKSTVSKGTTYNKPVVNVTLPTTETFTGLLTGGVKWTCTILTIHTAKCTDTSASVIGTLGNITGTVKFTGAGVTQVTTATLSDPVDNATANSSTFKESSTTTPVLKETASPLTVASHSIGTTYKLTLKSTVSKGTTYNKPVVNVTLPTTETFTGLLTGGVKWTCTILTIHTAKCTDTSASVLGTLGNITGTVKFTGTGVTQITTATLSDPVDNATANSSTFKESSTTTPVLKETATPLTVASHSIGTTYKLTLKSTVSSGTTYNKPVVNVTLPTTETFTGLLAGGAKWTCTVLTIHTAKCTDTSASVLGTLGNITGTVKFTGAGATQVTTATLSDPVDNATANSSTFKESSTATPVLKETATPLTVVSHSIGTTYKLTLKSTVSSGTTYNKPVVNVTLPTTETFTGLLTGGAKWTCTVLTIHTAKCTDTSASVLGTLGNITGTVKFSGAGVTQITTATLSDPVDNATANSSTFKESSTTTPVLKETATPLTVVSHSIGTTYKLTLKSTVLSGTTYNKPVVNVTLPTTETFTGILTGGVKWTCTILTPHTAKCTDTSASVLGTLGNITGTVKFSGAGVTQVTTATLSDPVDNATANSSTFKESSTTTPVLKETATPLTVVSHSIGTTYKLTLKSTVSSGTTYNKPVVNVTLPTTETFTGILTGGAKWTCTILTIHTAKCTDTSASVIGTLGNITGTVKFTGTGVTQVTTATLSDPVDNATANSSTFKESSTTTPVLKETATPLTVVSHSIGTTYKLTLKSTVSKGTTYNKPVVNVTLPTTETFTGLLTGGVKWTCTILTIHTAKCTDTSASVLGTLGNITGTVKFSGAGVTQVTTATLSDPVDNATANSSTFKESLTATPILNVVATASKPAGAVGTTDVITVKPTMGGGKSYNAPTVTITLPGGEAFTGTPTGGASWTCATPAGLIDTCTHTPASVGTGTLGLITAKIKFTGTGSTLQTKVLLADTLDGAASASGVFKLNSTATPVFSIGAVPSKIAGPVGTTYSFSVTSAITSGKTYHAPVLTITLPTSETFSGTAPSGTGWTCKTTGTKKEICTENTKVLSTTAFGKITGTVKYTAISAAAVATFVLTDATDAAVAVKANFTETSTHTPILAVVATPSSTSGSVNTFYNVTVTASISLGKTYHIPTVTIALPTDQTFVGSPTGTTWTCQPQPLSKTAICTYSFPPGPGALQKITGTVKLTAAGVLSQTTVTLSDKTDGAIKVTSSYKVTSTPIPVLSVTATPSKKRGIVGTTYTLAVTSAVAGGPTHHAVTVTILLPPGQTVTPGVKPKGTTWICTVKSPKHVACVTNSTSVNVGTLGEINVTVKLTGTGNKTTTISVADPLDTATQATTSYKFQVSSPPILMLATPAVSTKASTVGKTFSVTITSALSASGGTALNDPILDITLPVGWSFLGRVPVGVSGSWKCTLTNTTAAVCTSQKFTPISNAVGSLTQVMAQVRIVAAGKKTLSVTLKDLTDLATSVTKSASVTAAATPKLNVTIAGMPKNASAGSTYTLTLKASLGPTGGAAFHDPIVTVKLPTGEKFKTDPKPANWTCNLSPSTTVLTCVSTLSVSPTPILRGTTFTPIVAKVTISKTARNNLPATVKMTDTPDLATPFATSVSVTASAPPQLGLTGTALPKAVSVGSSFVVTYTPSLKAAGGVAYHDPKFTLDLGTLATFALTVGPGWLCTATSSSAVCTSTKSTTPSILTGSLGAIKATIDPTSAGILSVRASLTDTPDAAATVAKTTTVRVTPDPKLDIGTPTGMPKAASVGTSYILSVPTSIGVTGPAYHDPIVTITLPPGEIFTGTPKATSGWNCTLTPVTKLHCTSTVAITPSIPATTVFPAIVVPVKITGTTTLATVIKLTDPKDQATPVSVTTRLTATADPVLVLPAPTGIPASASAKTSFTVTYAPALTASGGPAYHHPVLTVTLPTPGVHFSMVKPSTATAWTCKIVTSGRTILCTSTKSVTPSLGTGPLGTVKATVVLTTSGTKKITASLADTKDQAKTVHANRLVAVTPDPKLIVKVHSTPPAIPSGTPYTLLITTKLTVTGGAAHHDPTVTFTLPPGETITNTPVATTWNCTVTLPRTVRCISTVKPTITPGTTLHQIKIPITVTAGTVGTLSGTLMVKDPTDGATPVKVQPKEKVTATPVLTLQATGTPSPGAAVGTKYTLTFTPTLKATGGPAYHEPIMIAKLTAGETFSTDPLPANWTCKLSSSTTVLTCNSTLSLVSPIPVGGLGVITTTVAITGTGTKKLTATLTDAPDKAVPAVAVATFKATAPPKLIVKPKSSSTPTPAGTPFTLVVTVSLAPTPTGGPAYHAPTVVITIPPGEVFNGTPNPKGWTCKRTSSTKVICTWASTLPIPAGSTIGPIKVPVTTVPTAHGSLTTTIGTNDPTDKSAPTTAKLTTTITPVPHLVVSTTQTPSTPMVGSTYHLTITPSLTGTPGAVAYTKPVISVTLPTGETFASTPHQTGWNCTVTDRTKVLTCTSTKSTPIPVGKLGKITATIHVASTGAKRATVSITDPGGSALPGSESFTVNIVKPPAQSKADVGYRLVGSDGGVFAFGHAKFLGSLISQNIHPTAPISGITSMPTGNGYWICGQDGAVYAFGKAKFYGSLTKNKVIPRKPIVGMAATPTGKGYWLVAADGGVFAFGDAAFEGNTYTIGYENRLDKPVVGISATPNGLGYWLAAGDGGVFAFGDAKFYGNTYTTNVETSLDQPVSGIAGTSDGKGYWLTAGDGGIFGYGDAGFAGNSYTAHIFNQMVGPDVGIAANPTGNGYWFTAKDGGVFAFGTSRFLGNTYTARVENKLHGPITGIAFSR